MELLLDTHSFLWFSEDNKKLSVKAKALIEDLNNTCFVSIASLWEMSIKISLDKLKIHLGFHKLKDEMDKHNFEMLPVTFEHTVNLTSLPFYHRDPFDRLLIVQSITENLTIISADDTFDKYDVKRIW